jgi:sulfite dehydrogenase
MNAIKRLTRRNFLRTAGVFAAGVFYRYHANAAAKTDTITLPFANGARQLVVFPQKRPMILLTTRPPQLETPFNIFNHGLLTPNDAFFVRYHLSQVPTSIDPDKYTLSINGSVKNSLTLSLNDLKTNFDPVELIAVNQCSGNWPRFLYPAGCWRSDGQWRNGECAMERRPAQGCFEQSRAASFCQTSELSGAGFSGG